MNVGIPCHLLNQCAISKLLERKKKSSFRLLQAVVVSRLFLVLVDVMEYSGHVIVCTACASVQVLVFRWVVTQEPGM